MSKTKYRNAQEAKRFIATNGGRDVAITDSTKTIYAKNVGIGTWGAIDYLVKKHGYTLRVMSPPN